MEKIQIFLKEFQKEMKWEISNKDFNETRISLLNNYMLLTTELGEVGEEFRSIYNKTSELMRDKNINQLEAFENAKKLHKENIGSELADCIAYIVKFANYFEINLEESFYTKMNEIKGRSNKDAKDSIIKTYT